MVMPASSALLALRRSGRLGFGVQFALGEIDRLAASAANVGLVELVGKNFLFFPAAGAFADKGLEVLEGSEAGAMLGC